MNPIIRLLVLVLMAIVAVRVDALEEIETITKTAAMEKYNSGPTHIIHSESSPSYKHTHAPSHTVFEETHVVKKEGSTTYLRTSARSLQDMSTMEPSSTPTLEPI